MSNDQQNNPDIYSISKNFNQPETPFPSADHLDIFAVKKENSERLGSIIGIALGAGVFLCNAYRLDKLVSRDEMGEIWKASDLGASRNVCIYLPPLEIRKDESAIEPIRQNAKRVEVLDHPRIIPVLENYTDPEHGLFTVQQFVDGKTLDVYWKGFVRQQGKLAPGKAVKILSDLAHALDYAHRVGIVHGNLCPKNIIVGHNDEVSIGNFALLPVPVEAAAAARTPYLPPEVVERAAATVPSDTYALAVIAYELLSGCLPYSPESSDMPPHIPGVSSTADIVIRKALAKVPDDRYDSCGAFVRALEESFQEPKKSKPAAVKSSLRPKLPRAELAIRLLWCGVASIFLLIAGTAAWISWKFHQLPQKPEPLRESAVQRTEPLTLPPEPVPEENMEYESEESAE